MRKSIAQFFRPRKTQLRRFSVDSRRGRRGVVRPGTPEAAEGVRVHAQGDRQHEDLHDQLRPDHAVQAEERAPRALVSASGMNRRRICGAKAAKQATKQAESARAAVQENTDTLRIRL